MRVDSFKFICILLVLIYNELSFSLLPCLLSFQLKNDDLIIGKEMLRQVLEDAGKDIQQLIRNERNEYKIEAEKQKLELIDNVNMKVREIADERNVSVGQLKETLKASVDALEAKAQERKKMLDETVDEGIKNVKAETENALKKIQIANESKRTDIFRRCFIIIVKI